MLIRDARVWPSGPVPVTDVRIIRGRIAECAPGLRPAPGEVCIDAAGRALLPGLHDHHIHLRALAASLASVAVGPPRVRTPADLTSALRAADATAPPGAWLRCVGYHESVAGPLDRWVLDRMLPHRPVRVQHRTGALWVVNSAGAVRLGLDDRDASVGRDLGDPRGRRDLSDASGPGVPGDVPGVERDAGGRATGRLWRLDRWLATRIPRVRSDLAAVSARAAALGVTGFTDATPDATQGDVAALAAAVADGTVVQRVQCMAPPGVAWPRGRQPAKFTLGPVKILLDDDRLPALGELTDLVRQAHAAGRPVAVHCVTRVQFVLTLAALDTAGRLPGDRIEHGAVIPAELIAGLRGLTVVTQPHFAADRAGQYASDVPAEDLRDLWRLRTLIEGEVAVAAGSDAPFGASDPWHVMRAATQRPPGPGPDEAITPARALNLFLGDPAAPGRTRRIAPRQPADLIMLRCPPAKAARSLASDLVAATFAGGELVYSRDGAVGRAETPRVRSGKS